MGRIQKIQKEQTLKTLIFYRNVITILVLPLILCSCVSYKTARPDKKNVSLFVAAQEIPEEELLDVRIHVFDPGTLPTSQNAARGLSEDIRKAEARYIPVQIRNAMQQTGHWGAVRVVPAGSSGDEVQVLGRIVKSNGEELHLEIEAFDATGTRWFRKKIFKSTVSINKYKASNQNKLDIFRSIYNQIANELALYRQKMSSGKAHQIRQTAEMSFAEELAPSYFSSYLKRNKGSRRVSVDRLPPAEDEMLKRVRSIRERNYMLVDTLDAYYEGLHRDMKDVYTEWRKSRLVEMNIIREIDARKNTKLMQGTGVVVGTTILGVLLGNDQTSSTVTNAAISAATVITTKLLLDAQKIKQEADINKAALEELGESFAADVEDTVVNVEGNVVRLTGSAEEKYQQWREAMKRLTQVEIDGDIVNSPSRIGAQISNDPARR